MKIRGISKMLTKMIEKMQKQLVMGEEFRILLKELINDEFNNKVKIQYILIDKEGTEYYYGECGENSAQLSKECDLEDGYKVRINIWQKNDELEIEQCAKLFEKYWNKEYCDSVCGLPATDRGSFSRKCDYTIKEWQKEGKTIAFVMMDLDNFKQVNTSYGHEMGTKVISEFSRVLFREINGQGVLIHQSGDEFDLFFLFEDYTQIIELLHSVYKAVKKHEFSEINQIDLTMAIGVWIVDSDGATDFFSIRDKAEATYHPREKNVTKHRNSIRINKNNNYPTYGADMLETGVLRIWGNIHNNRVFHNVYLDYISCLVSKIAQHTNIQSELEEFLAWINPQYNTQLRITTFSEKWDSKVDISYIDIGLAVLQGILKNENNDGKNIMFQVKSNGLSISIDGEEVLHFSHESITGELQWEHEEHCKILPDSEVRKTVLVQAGYTTKLQLPEDIFYRVVRVDARPFLGGGLPDLWAATLSALINSMNDNSNFNDIVVLGDVQSIQSVMEILNDIPDWNEEQIRYISKKTYKSEGDILKFKAQCGSRVQIYTNEEEVIKHIYATHKQVDVSQQMRKGVDEKKRFMIRTLPYENLQLEVTDGCRTDTIAHAFPIALEILRNRVNVQKEITDQAGRKLLELTDFKIVLETPRNEKLPEYYFYDEGLLNAYYENVFVNKEGLFRKRLEKDNQLEEMIKHVVLAISGDKIYATRRAILVVQNEILNEGNYSPLGLVAIWLAPRFVGNRVMIDYSYTWRTVEAIVGLPLSMYASVKFAEEITERIVSQVSNELYEVEMGRVSYIAHSLHMFTDEESMNIVRGIINEVSV